MSGPIVIPHLFNGRDKLFFFVDMDNYTSPQSRSFTREILTQNASNGLFTYATATPQAGNAWTTCVASSPPPRSRSEEPRAGLVQMVHPR